ncbi:MAG: hypothetical protein J6Y20_10115 [Lachnospiraceae bacterium]|nr:hypothetical protein [Lachnospiraceae bacterium]MBP5462468.1 hypothetical protein [Lachnospiraceae bacterium]
MGINDIANKLDGWTRLRVDLYDDDTGTYNTIFDSDDWPGWSPCDLNSFVNPTIDDFDEIEVEEIALEDDHIVLRCDRY